MFSLYTHSLVTSSCGIKSQCNAFCFFLSTQVVANKKNTFYRFIQSFHRSTLMCFNNQIKFNKVVNCFITSFYLPLLFSAHRKLFCKDSLIVSRVLTPLFLNSFNFQSFLEQFKYKKSNLLRLVINLHSFQTGNGKELLFCTYTHQLQLFLPR